MSKVSLRVLGTYPAWSPYVVEAVVVREGVPDVPMLVRSDGEPVSDDALAQARADVLLLARLRHEHVLRVEFVTAVEGRIGQVFEHSGGVSLERVLAAERASGRPVPLRVVVEIAAGVAGALDEAGRLMQGGSRVDHPGPDFGSVLIERTGRSKLAGFVVTTGVVARRAGYRAPEAADRGASALTWMSAQFLVELLRACALEGEVPVALAAAIASGTNADPEVRPAPGAFARALREIAANLSGISVRSWADVPVRAALEAARITLPSSGPHAGRGTSAATTIVPDLPTEESPVVLGSELHGADWVDLETSDHGAGRGDAAWPGNRQLNPLPVRVGPSATLPPLPPSQVAAQSNPPVRPGPSMPSPLGHARPEPTVSLGLRGERGVASAPRRVEPLGAGPALAGPALPGPALAGPALPRVDLAMGGAGLELPEPDAPPPSRSGLYAGLLLVGVLSVLGVAMASAAVYWYAHPTEPVSATGPVANAPTADPVVQTPGLEAPVAAPLPVALPEQQRPAPPQAPPAPPPVAAASTAPAMPKAGDEASRIVAGMRGASAAPAAAAPAAAVAAASVPDDPGPFDVSFKPSEGEVTTLEVRCAAQSGSGMIIELNQVPKGTSCKITGLGGAAPLQTLVTVNSARSYSCFANGSRSCR